MQKILVINDHPNPEASVAGKAVLNALESSRCEMQIRTLAQLCGPNGFDVTAEQEALRRADVIVWHFPFYWYSVPAILKKWIDDVLMRGFAHGAGGTALHDKKLLLSFTTGAAAQEYAKGRAMNWPVEAFLPPLLQTAYLCGMKTLAPVWSNGMIFIPGVHTETDRKRILKQAEEHAARLLNEIKACAEN